MNLYDCYRCGFRSARKSTMKNHLNKINKCKRTVESFKYTDEECYELSLINKNKDVTERVICMYCKKTYSNKYNLDNHIHHHCKMYNKKGSAKKEENIYSNIKTNIQQNIINNNTTNIIFINNIHNKTPVAFNREWTTDHIDIHIKQLLYLTEYKYTKFLTKILEEDSNLNVILDKKEKTGYVYDENKKSYVDMNKSEIISESMKKLYNGLLKMKEEFTNDDNIENIYISENIIQDQSEIVKNKYNEYIKNDKIKKTVEECIIDIFEEKKKDALKIYDYTKNSVTKKNEHVIGF